MVGSITPHQTSSHDPSPPIAAALNPIRHPRKPIARHLPTQRNQEMGHPKNGSPTRHAQQMALGVSVDFMQNAQFWQVTSMRGVRSSGAQGPGAPRKVSAGDHANSASGDRRSRVRASHAFSGALHSLNGGDEDALARP
jgi:hypothetical protein